MNPISIFQMISKNNPQQFLQQIAENNQMMSNPMMKNIIGMARKGDMQGVENMARNLCREKGINADEMYNAYKQKFGI